MHFLYWIIYLKIEVSGNKNNEYGKKYLNEHVK